MLTFSALLSEQLQFMTNFTDPLAEYTAWGWLGEVGLVLLNYAEKPCIGIESGLLIF